MAVGVFSLLIQNNYSLAGFLAVISYSLTGPSVIKESAEIQSHQWFASSKQGFHPLKYKAIIKPMIHHVPIYRKYN